MKIRFSTALMLVLFCTLAANAQQASKDLLRKATTIHVTASEGPRQDLKSEVIKKLVKWGKLSVVSDPDKADLILKVELTRGFSQWKGKGARGAAELTDRQTSA